MVKASDRITRFSDDRVFRYTLWRSLMLGEMSYALWLALNPSTADEHKNDPTITREMDFTKQWGYGAMCKVNLFAYRSTDPKVMRNQVDPVGPENDQWILEMAAHASIIILAYGAHGSFRDRDRHVLQLLKHKPLHCIGLTKGGQPIHPLYQPRTSQPILFRNPYATEGVDYSGNGVDNTQKTGAKLIVAGEALC